MSNVQKTNVKNPNVKNLIVSPGHRPGLAVAITATAKRKKCKIYAQGTKPICNDRRRKADGRRQGKKCKTNPILRRKADGRWQKTVEKNGKQSQFWEKSNRIKFIINKELAQK